MTVSIDVREGVTGEYRPGRSAAVERPRGRGFGDLSALLELGRSDELAGVRDGSAAWLHSWELVTSVDGPGTRLTIFLNGCPLRCQYCHNPDTMRTRQGQLVSLEEIVAKLHRYRRVFRATRGGLTISGGEPMMQPAFVQRLLRAAKELGIHTAMDTSGNLGGRVNSEIMADLDLVLLDVKSGDPATYRRVTGADLAPTLEFGDRLSRAGVETWVRFVLVPGLTDDEVNVRLAARHVAAWGSVSRVEVLPFHQMGRDKWANLGLTYELEGTQPPTPELLERVRAQFRSEGLTVY